MENAPIMTAGGIFVTNKKIADLAAKLAGDQLQSVMDQAACLVMEENKTFERAIADALENLKLTGVKK